MSLELHQKVYTTCRQGLKPEHVIPAPVKSFSGIRSVWTGEAEEKNHQNGIHHPILNTTAPREMKGWEEWGEPGRAHRGVCRGSSSRHHPSWQFPTLHQASLITSNTPPPLCSHLLPSHPRGQTPTCRGCKERRLPSLNKAKVEQCCY